MASEVTSSVQTVSEVMEFMAPFAGGSVPSDDSTEYANWLRWIQTKQEEYARRAHWRRCLAREDITLSTGYTTVLPDRFNRPNALYMLLVPNDDGENIDWNEYPNEAEQYIFVEMVNDPSDENFGKWQMRFEDELTETKSAVIWYFANPPKPTATTDKLLLPGDMIAYAALGEYFRQANQPGSQDDARNDAEARFSEYLSLEVIPAKNELLTHSPQEHRLTQARTQWSSRPNRNTQHV